MGRRLIVGTALLGTALLVSGAPMISATTASGQAVRPVPTSKVDPFQQYRVINGDQVQGGQLDFVVALLNAPELVQRGPFDAQYCGGTLTTPSTVVTAAHCVVDPFTRTVASPGVLRVGIGRTLQSGKVRIIAVTGVRAHPDYDPASGAREIAVLTLAQPQPDLPTLTPLQWPEREPYEAPGTPARIAGWGTTSATDDLFPARLQAASVVLFPERSCGAGSRFGVNGMTFDGFQRGQADPAVMVCAAGATGAGRVVDSCQGDSGGPLMVGEGLAARLVGIVSWGEECASTLPGVYTRVSAVADFLLASNAIITTPPAQSPSIRALGLPESIQVWFMPTRDGMTSLLAATATNPDAGTVSACFVRPRRDNREATCAIGGLTEGVPYSVAAIAANTAGNSAPTQAVQVTPTG